MFKKQFLLLVMIFMVYCSTSLAETESLLMTVGDCKILALPAYTRVATSSPEVIEVVVTSGREVILNAKKIGLSVVNIWTPQGIITYRISVQEDYSNIEREIARLINNSLVQVTVNAKYVILNGKVETSLESDLAVQYSKMYRENIINNLDIKTKYQILLSITVTEMKKETQNKYGFRWGRIVTTKDGPVFTPWEWSMLEAGNNNFVRNTAQPIAAMLDAMQKNGDAKILAAPSILTLSGKEAQFLVGGEIPIPLTDKDGIKVEWKEYGVKLKVIAVIEKDNSISMTISPEVSSIDWANAILINNYKLPALATRKETTSVQFTEGKTLVIGGLLKREDSETVFKLPILGDLPIIGALFRSKEFQNGNTELLFFVTPYIIKNDSQIDSSLITNPKEQELYNKSGLNDNK